LEQKGLIMYGQMTAGSWAFIGTQGILQGTYETLAAVAKKHFAGSLRGKFVLTAGLGEMGGAQPLAVTMNEGVALVVEINPWAIERRLKHGYLDDWTDRLDEAVRMVSDAKEKGVPRSIGLLGNAAEVHPELLKRGIIFSLMRLIASRTFGPIGDPTTNCEIPDFKSSLMRSMHKSGVPQTENAPIISGVTLAKALPQSLTFKAALISSVFCTSIPCRSSNTGGLPAAMKATTGTAALVAFFRSS